MSSLKRFSVLGGGVFCLGWAAIFFRLADEAPALTVAAYRLAIASVILVALASFSVRAGYARLPARRHWPVMAVSGVFLALHFWSWFASLERTSVASSVVIVTMQPLLGALLAYLLFRERPAAAELCGLGLAAVGLAVIAGGDLLDDGVRLQGDLFALAGAFFAAAYLTVGRHVRNDTGTLTYSAGVYLAASAVLWLLVAIVRPDVGPFAPDTWTFLVLLALVPQLLGHTSINWALGHFRVVTVGLAILGEPVISTLLAIPVLDEWPPPTALVGGALILAGVILGLARGGTQTDVRTVSPSPAESGEGENEVRSGASGV